MAAAIVGLTGTVGGWGPFVAGIALKSTVLLFIAAFIAAGLRRSSAAARHLVWTLAVGSLLVLPVAPKVLPSWETPALDWLAPLLDRVSPAPGDRPMGQVALEPVPSPTVGPRAESSGTGALTGTGAALAWLVVSMALLLRVAWGHVKQLGMIHRARLLEEGHMAGVARDLATEMGVGRVSIHEGGPDAMPCAWGLARPSILLPSSALSWSSDRLRNVLVHELSHVRRHDCGIQLLAEVVRAVYWPHPMVWVAVRRLREESEGACDDAVLATGARPSTYAMDLIEIARSLRPGPLAAVVSMARRPRLDERVRALLDDRLTRAPVGSPVVFSAVLLSLALVLLVALVRPVMGGTQESAVPSNPDCSTVVTEENMNARRLIAPLVVAASFGCGEQVVVPDAGTPALGSAVEQASSAEMRVVDALDYQRHVDTLILRLRAHAESLRSGSAVPTTLQPPTDYARFYRLYDLARGDSSVPPRQVRPIYRNHIAPLFRAKCEGCHRMGGSGPMTFATYAETRPWAPLIHDRVIEMEGGEAWHELRSSSGTRELHWRLTPEETRLILDWVDAGMPF